MPQCRHTQHLVDTVHKRHVKPRSKVPLGLFWLCGCGGEERLMRFAQNSCSSRSWTLCAGRMSVGDSAFWMSDGCHSESTSQFLLVQVSVYRPTVRPDTHTITSHKAISSPDRRQGIQSPIQFTIAQFNLVASPIKHVQLIAQLTQPPLLTTPHGPCPSHRQISPVTQTPTNLSASGRQAFPFPISVAFCSPAPTTWPEQTTSTRQVPVDQPTKMLLPDRVVD